MGLEEARRAAGEVVRDRAPRTTWPPPTAATTSPTSRSAPRRTARSPRCKVKTYANMGGRLSTIGPGIPTTLYGRVMSRPLQDPQRPRRGHRRLHQHRVGRRLPRRRPARRRPSSSSAPWTSSPTRPGVDPAEVRRRNFIQPDDFPYEPIGLLRSWNGAESRSTAATTSRRWTRRWRWSATPTSTTATAEAERARQAASASGSRPTSRSAASPPRSGSASSARAGAPGCGSRPTSGSTSPARSCVTTGSPPHGQGHETTFAQIVADELGVAVDDIQIEHSDTLGHARSASAPTAAAPARSAAWPPYKRRREDQGEGQAAGARTCSRRPRRHRLRGRQGSRVKGSPDKVEDDRRDRARRARRLTTCPRAWSRASTRRPTTTRRTAPCPSARTSRRRGRPGDRARRAGALRRGR